MFLREDIAKIADSIRTSLNLQCPYDPARVVDLLKGRISETGDIAIDALIKKDQESFIIYLNPHKPYTRERFTLAHELGHLFLHMGFLLNRELWNSIPEGQFQDSAYYRIDGNYTQEEHEANEFAAAFLMPRSEFIEISKKYLNNNQYSINPIADHFKVSKSSAINRGRWLGIFEW
jgi:Zn-dependent peptidase ImmA (M78 family)